VPGQSRSRSVRIDLGTPSGRAHLYHELTCTTRFVLARPFTKNISVGNRWTQFPFLKKRFSQPDYHNNKPPVSRSFKGPRANPDLSENYYTNEDISRISKQLAWYSAGRDHHDDTLLAIFVLDVTIFTTWCHPFLENRIVLALY